MCGIIGYLGYRPALPIIIDALTRMEYRGYDSAGLIVLDGNKSIVAKKAGRLSNLRAEIADKSDCVCTAGMGHTRWATHGRPTDQNAHPHTNGQFAVVHNGIIENYAELKAELITAGAKFHSDTDTEVAVHLLSHMYQNLSTAGNFIASAQAVISRLEGAFTIVFTCSEHPDIIIAARRSTPLVLGVGHGEIFLASDVSAFIDYTRDAVEIGQDTIVIMRASGYELMTFDGHKIAGRPFYINWDIDTAEKGGFDFFMDKEINEQPAAVANTLCGHVNNGHIVLDEQRLTQQQLRDINKVFIIACGSAYHAGLVAKYAVEHWTRIPVEVELASEFRYRDPVLDQSTLVIAISQSGETLDTLEALRHAKEQGARVIAVSNTVGSQIARESDAVVYTHAGLEIAVASTKCFLAQIVASYLVGLALASACGTKTPDEIAGECTDLADIPSLIEILLRQEDAIRRIARNTIVPAKTVLFIGRNIGYPVALEGALKLKELAYVHAEGFAAGELKHGSIALIEEGVLAIIVMPSLKGSGVLHSKMVSNIREIQARGAHTIVIAEEGDDMVRPFADVLCEIPASSTLLLPLLATVPLQIFASETARARGYDVDKPRNLAKSVTVE